MKKKSKNTLSADYILKINNIFKKNNWNIEETENKNESLFNRYCQRVLDIGENEKRNLFLELSERYLWLPQEKYLECLMITLKKLLDNIINFTENIVIYVMPLIAPEDIGKVKSSLMLSYLFNDVKIKHDDTLGKYRFQLLYGGISDIKKLISGNNNYILLVDDFIGTGKTAEKCILNLGIDKTLYNKIKIISLVAQEEGINYISRHGIQIFSYSIRKKGITDYYSNEELNKKTELMKQIETKMSVKHEYRFGYGKSESLVTMCRTPNNTFPIFWEEKGNMKIAPFPRN